MKTYLYIRSQQLRTLLRQPGKVTRTGIMLWRFYLIIALICGMIHPALSSTSFAFFFVILHQYRQDQRLLRSTGIALQIIFILEYAVLSLPFLISIMLLGNLVFSLLFLSFLITLSLSPVSYIRRRFRKRLKSS